MSRLTNFSVENYANSYEVPIFGSSQGKKIFVRPSTGSDANDGLSPDKDSAVKTLVRALAIATANQNDVVYLIAESNTAASTTDYQSSTLTWNKDMVHLVGVGAPGKFSQRARVAQLSTATSVSPLVNVTANACYFGNFSIFHGVADAGSLVALQVTGQRNYFEGMHIAGMGHATQVASNAASLKLNGASECTFKNCVIGLDTISRDQNVKGEIWFDGDASRIWFEDCLVDAYISNAGYDHVTVEDATGIDRGVYFKNCLFMSKSTNKSVTQTQVFAIPAISQGAIVLMNTYAFSDGGAVDWDGSNRGIIWNNSVAAAAAAAGGIMTGQ